MSVTECGIDHTHLQYSNEGNRYYIGLLNQNSTQWLRSKSTDSGCVWIKTGWGIDNTYLLAYIWNNSYTRNDFSLCPIIRLE